MPVHDDIKSKYGNAPRSFAPPAITSDGLSAPASSTGNIYGKPYTPPNTKMIGDGGAILDTNGSEQELYDTLNPFEHKRSDARNEQTRHALNAMDMIRVRR